MEKKNDLGKKILDNLQKKHIHPIPKIWFLGKEGFFWGALFGGLIAAIIGSATFVFVLFSQDWDVGSQLAQGWWNFLFQIFPFFLAVFIIVLACLIYISIRQTCSGYKYRALFLILPIVFIIMSVGGVIHFFGGGEKTDTFIKAHIPAYHDMHIKRMRMWHQPERGFLAGKIISIQEENVIILEDMTNTIWTVHIEDLEKYHLIRVGMRIKMIGEMLDVHIFSATTIRPWMMSAKGIYNKNERK
ncbi:MAG: hypothetical protein HOE80_04130 [Candidatus Magasanikbacteria bacterium]|nr:hypothetical protein [Candidatus Magasanikbacteria bacterium]MBT4071882.1 hypothetical protein [Candidatus Magasanikbacteria bacterium]